jgi:hypothetical protein
MTPKEKADELFNKMDMIIYTDQDNWKSQCIRCALIAVEEILQEVPEEILDILDTYKGEINFVDNERYKFWQNVKLELETYKPSA